MCAVGILCAYGAMAWITLISAEGTFFHVAASIFPVFSKVGLERLFAKAEVMITNNTLLYIHREVRKLSIHFGGKTGRFI